MRFCALISAVLLLAACGSPADDGIVDVALIGNQEELFDPGLRLSTSAQHIRAATAEGLVSLDRAGGIAPGIAERWIVTDDGASYIFRLRDSAWPDGTPITGENVRNALRSNLRALRGTSLGLDLLKISEVRAMTGRVVEIRLTSPMPDFLHLLAQPELGLRRDGAGVGPMQLEETDGFADLTVLPPEVRGLPRMEDWQEQFRPVRVRALDARSATEAFGRGEVEVVLNGKLATLPYADTGALSRGTVRLVSALGLFGLQVRTSDGFLANAANREALALAVDREVLMEPFNIGGWIRTTRIVAPGLSGDSGLVGERWTDLSIEQRRAVARQRVNAWRQANGGGEVSISISLPEGPGSGRLYRRLSAMYREVGITLRETADGERGDLALKDRTARYAEARWFLNQFHCDLTNELCSPEADRLVAEATRATDPTLYAELIAEAERQLTAENYFIPLGAPIRWSLVRAGIEGFEDNAWAIHPLFSLASNTI